MNETISLLLNRRSYRNFIKNQSMDKEDLDLILKASKQAPSSMNFQFYSIIVVDEPKGKELFAKLSPYNPFIADCGVFLIYVLDFTRAKLTSVQYGNEHLFDVEDKTEAIMLGTVDASLAMENAIIASEALGYRSVCIGDIRGLTHELREHCGLPDYTFPVCGLCIGKVEDECSNFVKPRFEFNVGYNEYHVNTAEEIAHYDELQREFNVNRVTKDWSEKLSKVCKIVTTKTDDDLRKQKFKK